jgi:hypothetical protein
MLHGERKAVKIVQAFQAQKKQLLPGRETRQELSARKIALNLLSATFTARFIINGNFWGGDGKQTSLRAVRNNISLV